MNLDLYNFAGKKDDQTIASYPTLPPPPNDLWNSPWVHKCFSNGHYFASLFLWFYCRKWAWLSPFALRHIGMTWPSGRYSWTPCLIFSLYWIFCLQHIFLWCLSSAEVINAWPQPFKLDDPKHPVYNICRWRPYCTHCVINKNLTATQVTPFNTQQVKHQIDHPRIPQETYPLDHETK